MKKAAAKRLGAAYGLRDPAGERQPLSDPVRHREGRGHPVPGHLRRGAVQAGLPGPEHGRAPAGDAGGGPGDPLPLPGEGPLLRPLLRQRHHPHRGGPHREEPGSRAWTGSFAAQKWRNMPIRSSGWTPPTRPWTRSSTAPTTSGAGTSTPPRWSWPQHNAELAGVEDCVRFEVADAGQVPPGERVRPAGDAIPPTASGCWRSRRPRRSTAPSAEPLRDLAAPSGGCWYSPPTRSLSGAFGRPADKKAQALQRYAQMRRIPVRKITRRPSPPREAPTVCGTFSS